MKNASCGLLRGFAIMIDSQTIIGFIFGFIIGMLIMVLMCAMSGESKMQRVSDKLDILLGMVH